MGNLYRDKQRTGCRYAPGGRLLEDPGWIYAYDDGGNLVHKISKTTRSKHISLIVDDDNPASMLEWHYEWNADGTLKTARNSDHVHNRYEYDALGRRTAKTDLTADTVTRFVWDGNVPLHEWTYPLAQRPALLEDEHGDFYYEKQEPRTNLTTWIFDEGTFAPSAKLVDGRQYSIITDHLGTPYEAYDEKGKRVWDRELDVYGKVILENGEKNFIPFRYQGQYYDEDIELCYNRFRYYSPDTGMFISQDPIGLEGGMALYAFVKDTNSWIDPLGLSGTHGHHSDPKFMGGDPKQKLTDLNSANHIDLHRDMNAYLETKTKVINGETFSMRPKRGNSGRIIRRNFTREERLDALAEFYSKNKKKYPEASADFFSQHPQLQKTGCKS